MSVHPETQFFANNASPLSPVVLSIAASSADRILDFQVLACSDYEQAGNPWHYLSVTVDGKPVPGLAGNVMGTTSANQYLRLSFSVTQKKGLPVTIVASANNERMVLKDLVISGYDRTELTVVP